MFGSLICAGMIIDRFLLYFLKCTHIRGFLRCFEWAVFNLQMQVNADKWQQRGSLSTFGHCVFQLPVLVSFCCWWKLQCTVDHSCQDWSTLTRPGLQDVCAFRISLKPSWYRLKHLKTDIWVNFLLLNFHCQFFTNLQAVSPGKAQQPLLL